MQVLVAPMLLYILAAGLLGVLFGWAWWGMRLREAKARGIALEQQSTELRAYSARIKEIEAGQAAFAAAKSEEEARARGLIAELEKNAAAVQSRCDGLAKRVTDSQAQLEANEIQIVEYAQANSDKDARLASLTARIAELSTQVETLKLSAEVPTVEAAQIAETPAQAAPIAMAAAAGSHAGVTVAATGSESYRYYDANESRTTPEPPTPTRGRLLEFEKRIDDLQAAEAAKTTEIEALRARLIEIEAAPDQDARRRLLFAAKTAEADHLKEVLNKLLAPIPQDAIAERAYAYAEGRGFQGGSEGEDWLKAEREIHHRRLAEAWTSLHGNATLY